MFLRQLTVAAIAVAITLLLLADHGRSARSSTTTAARAGSTAAVAAATSTTRLRPRELTVLDGARVNGLWAALLSAARTGGWDGRVKGSVSGLRTHDEQAALYRLYLAGRGAPAFPADGPSRHLLANVRVLGPWAQAVDVTHARELIRVGAELGVDLTCPYYPSEPWHVEAVARFDLADISIDS